MFAFRSANKFGGSLGGCADGVPAVQRGAKQQQQGRNGKSSVEQAETDLMISFPGGRGSTIDREVTGARNVNLRKSDEGVEMRNDKAGLSEVQHLELAMKAMLASFKQKVSHAQAEESETITLEVDPSNDHPLDDPDKAGYDPRFTEAILDVPRTHKITKGFVHGILIKTTIDKALQIRKKKS